MNKLHREFSQIRFFCLASAVIKTDIVMNFAKSETIKLTSEKNMFY